MLSAADGARCSRRDGRMRLGWRRHAAGAWRQGRMSRSPSSPPAVARRHAGRGVLDQRLGHPPPAGTRARRGRWRRLAEIDPDAAAPGWAPQVWEQDRDRGDDRIRPHRPRRTAPRGTDHGTGGAMLLAGGAIRGGRVYGRLAGAGRGRSLCPARPDADRRRARRRPPGSCTGSPGSTAAVLERAVFPGLEMGGDPGLLR